MKKIVNNVTNKLFSRIINRINRLEDKIIKNILKSQENTDSLVRELIVEERVRAETLPFGGIMQISEKEIATKLFNGSIMYLDPSDIAVVPHIVFESIWEKQITYAWQDFLYINSKAIVFDIGANFGYFGLLAAQILNKKEAKVYLFEPNVNLIPYINKTLSVNWLNENSVIVNSAVSDDNGTATLNVLKDYTGSSSLHSLDKLDSYLSHKMKIENEQSQIVKSVSIDQFCSENNIDQVDLIKMDIEGYEEKAYQGMRKTIQRSKNVTLFVEFTPDGYDNPSKFYKTMLQDFGNVYLINHKGKIVEPKNNNFESVIGKESDWIMVIFTKLSKKMLNNMLAVK